MTLEAGPVCGVGDSGSGNSDREQQHDPERDGADVAQHHGIARPVSEQHREWINVGASGDAVAVPHGDQVPQESVQAIEDASAFAGEVVAVLGRLPPATLRPLLRRLLGRERANLRA
ncbi:hypothetical protein ACPFP2_25985 [Micromonospora citrea]|uniref:hypothetical protein n=1 Tax=Micromonospora citrea TaxID=47855 RepID=UPI003C5AD310